MKPAKKKKLSKKIESKIMALFLKERGKTMNYKQVSSRLGESDTTIRLLIAEALVRLGQQNKLKEVAPGRFKLAVAEKGLLEGVIDISRRGSVFFVSDELDEDLSVRKKSAKGFLKGDRVLAQVHQHKGKEVATIVELLNREERSFVGIIEVHSEYAFLRPDDPFMPVDIFIPLNKLGGAKDGEKVLVDITDWPEQADSPFGRVSMVIGKPGETNVEMESILYEFGLPFSFPEEVLAAAERIPDDLNEKEFSKRRDFRSVQTFTIDPDDAKDFDDALSFEDLGDGVFRIGVHIADVSHYLKPGSVLDKEASKRATSVYLANQVVPMLPEILSNVLCSLRPNETKLCFSAVFDMDLEGNVIKSWVGRTVIHSDHRFTYKEAQEVLDSGVGPMSGALNVMGPMAQLLRADRMKEGGFEFNSDELSFVYDDSGRPIEVKKKVLLEANQLIEDFMLLANRTVAEWVKAFKPTPAFIYRNHDKPDLDKLMSLKRFVNTLDLDLDISTSNIRGAIKDLLESASESPHSTTIQQMVIRSMAKADYGVENIGHYGLSFEDYSHFTSPIRRYPDVIAHRLIQQYIDGQMKTDKRRVDVLAKHSSLMERKAVEAERASKKFMQALYLSSHIGKVFDGTVSGVTKFGLFVILDENHCEGMISLRNMDGDVYYFDENARTIVGQRTFVRYALGMPVRVRVKDAKAVDRRIDLELLD